MNWGPLYEKCENVCIGSIAVFAQESRNPNDELEVLRYERLAEQYLSADITAKELEQKYDGKVDIETIPLSEDKLDSVVSVLMDGKESDDIKSSVSLEKIHLENAESSMYVCIICGSEEVNRL